MKKLLMCVVLLAIDSKDPAQRFENILTNSLRCTFCNISSYIIS